MCVCWWLNLNLVGIESESGLGRDGGQGGLLTLSIKDVFTS